MLPSLTPRYPVYRRGNVTNVHQQWNALIKFNWILMPTLHYLSLLYLVCLPAAQVHTLKIPNVQVLLPPSTGVKHTNSRAPTPFIAYDRWAEVFPKWLITLESEVPVQQDFKKCHLKKTNKTKNYPLPPVNTWNIEVPRIIRYFWKILPNCHVRYTEYTVNPNSAINEEQ